MTSNLSIDPTARIVALGRSLGITSGTYSEVSKCGATNLALVALVARCNAWSTYALRGDIRETGGDWNLVIYFVAAIYAAGALSWLAVDPNDSAE